MKSRLPITILLSLLSLQVHATLINRGGGLIYDDEFNITWLQDANYGSTNKMTHTASWDWAQDLEYVDVARNQTWSDWRMPMWGELIGLYYRNGVGTNLPGGGAPFINLQPDSYWGWGFNQPIPNSAQFSAHLNFSTGDLAIINPGERFYAWAVRLGDVPDVTPIPAPSSLLLLGTGLLGLLIRTRAR